MYMQVAGRVSGITEEDGPLSIFGADSPVVIVWQCIIWKQKAGFFQWISRLVRTLHVFIVAHVFFDKESIT